MLPPGKCFEFIIEEEKLGNIKRVVSHHQGEILSETPVPHGIRLKVHRKRAL